MALDRVTGECLGTSFGGPELFNEIGGHRMLEYIEDPARFLRWLVSDRFGPIDYFAYGIESKFGHGTRVKVRIAKHDFNRIAVTVSAIVAIYPQFGVHNPHIEDAPPQPVR